MSATLVIYSFNPFLLDEAFFAAPGLIGVHPNDSTATVWLRADDLTALIQEHGNPVHIAEL